MASWLERLSDLGFDSYESYLRSAHWQQMRKRVGNSAHWTCRCGAPSTQTHHRTYVRLGRERMKDLVAICDPCHERIHDLVRDGLDLKAATAEVLEGVRRQPARRKDKQKAKRARQSAKRAARRAAAIAEAEHERAERQAAVRTTALDITARRLESIGMRDRPLKPKKKNKSGRHSYGELSIRTTATSRPAGAPGSIPGSSSSPPA